MNKMQSSSPCWCSLCLRAAVKMAAEGDAEAVGRWFDVG